MSDQPNPADEGTASDGLDELPYSELHDRAFALAQHRHDLRFFLDLYDHTRAAHAAATEGGSLGDFSGSLMELVEATRETFSDSVSPELEPLFRARFITYLREHGK